MELEDKRSIKFKSGKLKKWYLKKKEKVLMEFGLEMERYWLNFSPKSSKTRETQGIKKFITTNNKKKNMG